MNPVSTNKTFLVSHICETLLIVAVLLLYSSLVSAAIYQCKNASGKIAFQDHPCVDTGVNDNRYHDNTGTITNDDKKHFLWKATRFDQSVYLLGSIHVGRSDMYPLHGSVMAAFHQSEVLMVEVNTQAINQLKLAETVRHIGMYPEGTTLEQQIPKPLWEQLVATGKALNVPEIMFQRQKPWLASITLTTAMIGKSGYQADYGIDKYFLKQATDLNKEIVELESIDSQMQLFANFSDAEQLSLLSNGLNELKQGTILFDKLVNAWSNGDHQALDKLARGSMGVNDKESSLFKVMITDRNQSMAQKIIKAMQDKRKYFVVVGAAHLVGKQGVPALLKAQGFTIEAL
ncbi:MAG: TraB/GumN family protein [Methylococcales bacterium]